MSELAEGARLEIVCAAKSGTEGSNPSLSAIIIWQDEQDFLDFLFFSVSRLDRESTIPPKGGKMEASL